MIVKGLFNFEFGFPLGRHWNARVTNFPPSAEVALMPKFLDALGPGPERIERVVGDGTVQYTAWRSRWLKYCSIWHLTLFGGLKVGGDEDFPGLAFDRWSVGTFRDEDAPMPLDEDERQDVDGARAWRAVEGGRSS